MYFLFLECQPVHLLQEIDWLPIMIEAKSAGDYTNVNKRRKEEATKMQQLRNTYGNNVTFPDLQSIWNHTLPEQDNHHRYLSLQKARF